MTLVGDSELVSALSLDGCELCGVQASGECSPLGQRRLQLGQLGGALGEEILGGFLYLHAGGAGELSLELQYLRRGPIVGISDVGEADLGFEDVEGRAGSRCSTGGSYQFGSGVFVGCLRGEGREIHGDEIQSIDRNSGVRGIDRDDVGIPGLNHRWPVEQLCVAQAVKLLDLAAHEWRREDMGELGSRVEFSLCAVSDRQDARGAERRAFLESEPRGSAGCQDHDDADGEVPERAASTDPLPATLGNVHLDQGRPQQVVTQALRRWGMGVRDATVVASALCPWVRQAVEVAVRGVEVGEAPELPPVALIEGFGVVDEAVAERKVQPGYPWKIGAGAVGVLVMIVLLLNLLSGDDAPAGDAESGTTLPVATTSPPPPVRTTLAPPTVTAEVAGLPGVRPAAQLTGVAGRDLYQLDLASGATSLTVTDSVVDQLFDLDGVLLARSGRSLLRLDPVDGTMLPIAEGVTDLARGYSPASMVTITRDGSGVVARIIGPDGVFRAGARLPGEAVVHGAIDDRLIVTFAGSMITTDGTVSPEGVVELGSGRVLGLGLDRLTRVVCRAEGCTIQTIDLTGLLLAEVPVPEILEGAAPARWSELGRLSPDGLKLLIELRHGNGSIGGAVVVDLVTGVGVHSPELGVDFGTPAWAPDSRFVVYPFDGDLMVWDVTAVEGQLPSARAPIDIVLDDVSLR